MKNKNKKTKKITNFELWQILSCGKWAIMFYFKIFKRDQCSVF
jgi:hypothetical protein